MTFFPRRTVVPFALFACCVVFPIQALAADVTDSDFGSWKGLAASNDLIRLEVTPNLGGRVMQYSLGDFDYFWVNPQLRGKQPSETRLTPEGKWLNWGGEKLWPAPQGWDNDQHWPGPPDPVLDGGSYEPKILQADGPRVTIQLTSPDDRRSGIRFSRKIHLFDGTTRVHVEATMTNVDRRVRRWGIWSNIQQEAGAPSGEGFDPNVRVYCPMNPHSVFPKGYDVMFGLARNLQFQPDPVRQMMVVQYQYRVGKVALDSSAGWVATVHGSQGYVFVQRFTYHPDKPYPDNASVEIWTNGRGQCVIAGELVDMPDDPKENGCLVESEILSPLAELQPGESYTFDYDWFAASIGGDFPILDCVGVGVVCQELTVKNDGGRLALAGRFGIFYKGELQLQFFDGQDQPLGEAITLDEAVSPKKPIVFDGQTTSIAVPPGATGVCLWLVDPIGQVRNPLARAAIQS